MHHRTSYMYHILSTPSAHSPSASVPLSDICDQLRKCGISQADLARALRLSPQLISGVLTGRIRSLPTEIKIIKYLRDL